MYFHVLLRIFRTNFARPFFFCNVSSIYYIENMSNVSPEIEKMLLLDEIFRIFHSQPVENFIKLN